MCKKLIEFFRSLFGMPIPVIDEEPSPCNVKGQVTVTTQTSTTGHDLYVKSLQEEGLITETEEEVTTKQIPVPKKKKKYYYKSKKSYATRKAKKGPKGSNPI